MRQTLGWVLGLGLLVTGCGVRDAVQEAFDKASGSEAKGRLPSDPKDALRLEGELSYGDRTWTPSDCQWATIEGRTGMVFLNEGEGLALAVWMEGVPDGESNVWFVDRDNPPDDYDYQVGKKTCARTKLSNDGESYLDGAARVSCGGGVHAGELKFRNCQNTNAGSASARMKWPPK